MKCAFIVSHFIPMIDWRPFSSPHSVNLIVQIFPKVGSQIIWFWTHTCVKVLWIHCRMYVRSDFKNGLTKWVDFLYFAIKPLEKVNELSLDDHCSPRLQLSTYQILQIFKFEYIKNGLIIWVDFFLHSFETFDKSRFCNMFFRFPL